jgi:ACS family pantothenate transporter-like MFS transporter
MTLLIAWASNHMQHQPVTRVVMFSTGTFITYVLNMWVPILAYPASQAPNWTAGASVYLAFQLFATILFLGIHYGLDMEKRVRATT